MGTPYTKAFHRLPFEARRVLLELGISSAQPDGESLALLLEADKDRAERWALSALETMPENERGPDLLKDIMLSYTELANLATTSRMVEHMSVLELLDVQQQRSQDLDENMEDEELKEAVRKWKHYKPRKGQWLKQTTQRKAETEMRKMWATKLIAKFLPYEKDIPKMAPHMHKKDKMREYMDLFGARRWRTLKTYDAELKKILDIDPEFIPWDEGKLRGWMNEIRIEKDNRKTMTPSKLGTAWRILKPLSKATGLLAPQEIADLEDKKEAVMEELAKTLEKAEKRAVATKPKLVERLEMVAASKRPPTHRYLCAVVRLGIGASARFSDEQHTSPKTWKETVETIEYRAWQTKSMGLHQVAKKPIPIIATKDTLSGARWWVILKVVQLQLRARKEFEDMDYLLPALTRDGLGFIPRPAKNAQVLSWVKHILADTLQPNEVWGHREDEEGIHEMTAPEVINEFTLGAMRVFMAEWAYRAGIPRDLRRYIGRWAKEETADVYTREHRHVITRIWRSCKDKKELMDKGEEGDTVPEDLNDPHYWEDRPREEKHKKGKEMEEHDTLDASFEVVSEEEDISELLEKDVEDEHFTTLKAFLEARRGSVIEAGSLPAHLGGPLTPMINEVMTGGKKGRTRKIHLIKTDGVGIGCGTKSTKYRVMTAKDKQDIEDDVDTKDKICGRCFHRFTWPREFQSLNAAALGEGCDTSDSSVETDSDDSDSTASNDTASEEEAVYLVGDKEPEG